MHRHHSASGRFTQSRPRQFDVGLRRPHVGLSREAALSKLPHLGEPALGRFNTDASESRAIAAELRAEQTDPVGALLDFDFRHQAAGGECLDALMLLLRMAQANLQHGGIASIASKSLPGRLRGYQRGAADGVALVTA